jgi:iron transport multicopper oxidase
MVTELFSPSTISSMTLSLVFIPTAYTKMAQITTTVPLEWSNGTAAVLCIGSNIASGIPPFESLTYNFTVQQNGTYWIHSHVMGQYPDGLRSPFIIHNPNEPYTYDDEIIISFSDWYHKEMPEGIKDFMSIDNPTGAEPIPDAALMNDQQNGTIIFEPGKTYRLRLVNMAAFAMFHFWIEDHDMVVIEVDGVYTEPYTVQGVDLTTAQRVSVLVTAKNSTGENFAMVGAMDTTMFDIVPPELDPSMLHFWPL